METIWDAFVNAVAIWLPRVLAGLGILLIGWILAIVARALTRKVLSWTKLDARLAKRTDVSAAPPPPPGAQVPGGPPPAVAQPPREKPASVEEIISQFVYYLILFMAFLGALNALGMTEIAAWFTSMFNTIFAFLPRIIYALALAGLAWLVARLLKTLTTRALVRVGVDRGSANLLR